MPDTSDPPAAPAAAAAAAADKKPQSLVENPGCPAAAAAAAVDAPLAAAAGKEAASAAADTPHDEGHSSRQTSDSNGDTSSSSSSSSNSTSCCSEDGNVNEPLQSAICCGTSSSDSSNGCSSSNSSSGNSSSSNSSDSSSSGTEADSLGQQSCLAARSVEAFSTSSSSSNGCSSSSSNSSSNSSNIDTNSSSSSSNGGSKEACGKERVAPGSSSRSSSSSSSSTACERPSSISSSSLSRCSSAFEIDEMIQGFYSNPPVLLSEPELWSVCQRVKELLLEESNVQPVPAPVVVCGDIHGQLQDLLLLLHVAGSIPSTRYVFLGDYVDRGRNSVETFELLMLLKLRHPSRITLLRGNHESRQITTVYGFYDECLRKYGNANAWRFCCEVFDYLTLAALIEGSILCVHGGLSPDVHLLDQLQLIHRVREIPTEGAFGDLVWSDPDEVTDWLVNPRGAGWLYGPQAVSRFNHINGLDLIARAHQLAMQGFKYSFDNASVLTIWSAPNYCYRCGNVAAVLRLDPQLQRQLLIFSHAASSTDADAAVRAPVPYFL